MILQKLWSYITFKKQPEFRDETPDIGLNDPDIVDERDQPERNNGSYLKMMHGINRISIMMFIIGMIIVLIKIFK
jgi:hypothetical protein